MAGQISTALAMPAGVDLCVPVERLQDLLQQVTGNSKLRNGEMLCLTQQVPSILLMINPTCSADSNIAKSPSTTALRLPFDPENVVNNGCSDRALFRDQPPGEMPGEGRSEPPERSTCWKGSVGANACILATPGGPKTNSGSNHRRRWCVGSDVQGWAGVANAE